MSDNPSFPYVLDNVILVAVQCKRGPQVPENLQTAYTVELGVAAVEPAQLQVSLKCETVADAPVAFAMEFVGSFRLIERATRPRDELIVGIAVESAFPLLWQHVAQVILELTARMGMNPIRLPMPSFSAERPAATPEVQQVPPSP
jgi:hypothetical protein